MEVLKWDKRVKNIKSFFKSFFLYDGAKSRPPSLYFWTLEVIYYYVILGVVQKKLVGCKWSLRVLKGDKRGKNIKSFFKSFFSLWWSRKSTPQPMFLSSCCIIPSIYTFHFPKKNSWMQVKLKSALKLWKYQKKFFKSFFLYDGAENRPPNLGFLDSWDKVPPIYTCYFTKKTVECKRNRKILKGV